MCVYIYVCVNVKKNERKCKGERLVEVSEEEAAAVNDWQKDERG